ncbi:MAG: T9SS type A sorting domain-containing protein, partial [Bacteroidota bacterium]
LERTQASSSFWGIYVVNPSPLRPNLMIMCPHTLHDRNTGRQGAYVYAAVAPRMLGINGAHRCNSSLFSPCSGTTTVCSDSSQSYRTSDQAHVTDGLFQATTEAMLAFTDSTIQIQLHGFSKNATDPDIIMSNGTSFAPPPGQDYLAALRDNLTVVDPTLTFKVGHLDTGWTRLLGTTNVQGRLINGSPAPCTLWASSATGHFFHIEQKYSGLRDSQEGWEKMASAITLTFPQTPTDVRTGDQPVPTAFHVHQNYPNPFNPTTTIELELPEARHTSITVVDLLGRRIALLLDESRAAGTTRVRWDATAYPSGSYFCLVRAGEWRAMLRLMLVK